MIRIPKTLNDLQLSSQLILQVHDELLFEVKEAEIKDTVSVVTKVMETACWPVVDLDVPLIVDHGVGKNWAESH